MKNFLARIYIEIKHLLHIERKRRYFIVAYAVGVNDSVVRGEVAMSRNNGLYISSKQFSSMMSKKYKAIETSSLVITNIIELSKKDYETYTR